MGFEDYWQTYCAQTKTDVKTLTISGENVQQGPHVSDYIKFMGIFGHSLAARSKQFSNRNWSTFASVISIISVTSSSGRVLGCQQRLTVQCESKKSPLRFFWNFFPKRLGIFNQFFTRLLCDHFYTRLQIFIQLSPILTKLCHTKRDHLANFYISIELLTSKFAYWANDVIVDVMSCPTCLLTL